MKLIRLEVLRCLGCDRLALAVGGPAKHDATFLLSASHGCPAPPRWATVLSERHPLVYVSSRAFEGGEGRDARRGTTQPRGRKKLGTATTMEVKK